MISTPGIRILCRCALAVALAGVNWLLLGQGTKKSAPPAPSPASGAEMFRAYCASCHGPDARGNGPAAPALKRSPPDLTLLARRHQGKFPERLVFQTIEGEALPAAHGSREMPVWGTAFRTLGGSDEASVKLRIRNLTRYLETLQQR